MANKHEGALEQTRRLLEAQNREAANASIWRALALQVVGRKVVLPIQSVAELAVCENITPVPLTQPWVRGLTNVRGQVFLALWDAFKAHGISIPFPQREVTLMNEKLTVESG